MSAALRHVRVFAGANFALWDVHCRQGRCGAGATEYSRYVEVVFPRRGVFMKHVGRESVVADCNSVLFFNRDEPYRVSHPAEGGDECTVLRVREETLREAVGEYDPAAADRGARVFQHSHAPAEPAWMLRIAELRRHLSGLERDELAAEEVALDLVTETAGAARRVRGDRPARRAATAAAHRRLAEEARVLLAARFAEPLELSDVARGVHSSAFHLARVFRGQVGRSIHEYRTRLRLAAALARLSEGAEDLTALALDVGFSSHSHFATAFGRCFGVRPNEARGGLTRGRLREMSTILKA